MLGLTPSPVFIAVISCLLSIVVVIHQLQKPFVYTLFWPWFSSVKIDIIKKGRFNFDKSGLCSGPALC